MWARRAEHTFSEPVRVSEFLRESPSFSERASLSPRELAPRAPRDCARRGASPRRPTLSSSARRRCSAATTSKRPSSRRRAATSSAQRRSDTDPASHWPGPSLTAGYRIFNTWMGDMTKLLLFRAVLEAAEREGLQARAVSTGAALMRTLEAARERRPRCWGLHCRLARQQPDACTRPCLREGASAPPQAARARPLLGIHTLNPRHPRCGGLAHSLTCRETPFTLTP